MSTKLDMKMIGMKDLDSKLEELFKGLGNDNFVKVGILSGKTSRPDGGKTNAEIGFKQEFGSFTDNIPVRSFLRMPIETKAKSIVKSLASFKLTNIKQTKTLAKDMSVRMGILAEKAIQQAFASRGFGKWKRNSDITISGGWMRDKITGNKYLVKGKGTDSPLIDTGELRRSITSKVMKLGK